jgi:hypothetical protein
MTTRNSYKYKNSVLLDILAPWYDQLQEWSLSGRWTAAAQEALLVGGEPQALQELVREWSLGRADSKSVPMSLAGAASMG